MSRSAVMISYKKMNKEKDIKANLFRVVGDVATLVQVDYIDKNVVEHNGLFIVDSGSTEMSCPMRWQKLSLRIIILMKNRHPF